MGVAVPDWLFDVSGLNRCHNGDANSASNGLIRGGLADLVTLFQAFPRGTIVCCGGDPEGELADPIPTEMTTTSEIVFELDVFLGNADIGIQFRTSQCLPRLTTIMCTRQATFLRLPGSSARRGVADDWEAPCLPPGESDSAIRRTGAARHAGFSRPRGGQDRVWHSRGLPERCHLLDHVSLTAVFSRAPTRAGRSRECQLARSDASSG